MKIIHLSDLHIGKRVNEFSMIEDQRYILKQIYQIIDEEKPDAVLLAGDIYDRAVPSEEAVQLCDNMLTALSQMNTRICIISGNHDSAERLSFGSRLLKKSQINIASVFNGSIETVLIPDKDKRMDMVIYMLPFIKPSAVRKYFENKEIVTYDDAIKAVISTITLDKDKINVLMLHQFITGFKACESEELSVGTLDQVSAEHFKEFDYVALGHIHGPQNIKLPGDDGNIVPVRYCGTLLKYSFSEINHNKSVTVVEFLCDSEDDVVKDSSTFITTGENRKYNLTVRIKERKLSPLHEMREIKGSYEELVSRKFYKDTNVEDYIRVILTDEEDIPDALARLRSIYPNIMRLDYDNTRTRHKQEISEAADVEKKTPQQLFAELYRQQNNKEMSEEQNKLLNELVETIWR
ncbi:MAG: exonuclease SbcCD subunit D [Eubacteriales bacterium]|nr:exonuclease SbcCD subunit D [Eubacteriales bacterium]